MFRSSSYCKILLLSVLALIFSFLLCFTSSSLSNNNNNKNSFFVEAQSYRDWQWGYDVNVQIIWSSVYDPSTNSLLFVTQTAGQDKLFRWNLETNAMDHIAFSGTTLYAQCATNPCQATGLIMTFGGGYGITMGVSETTGDFLGYLVNALGDYVVYLVGINSPYPVSLVAGADPKATGDVPNSVAAGTIQGKSATFTQPAGMCYHKGWKKHIIADLTIMKFKLMTYNTAAGYMDVAYLTGSAEAVGAGAAAAGTTADDGVATAALFGAPFHCAMAPPSGTAPVAVFLTESSHRRVRRLTPISSAGTVTTIWSAATGGSPGTTIHVIEEPGGLLTIGFSDTDSMLDVFKVRTEHLTNAIGAGAVWPATQMTAVSPCGGVTCTTGILLPNGTYIQGMYDPGNPTVRVFSERGGLPIYLGSATQTLSQTQCLGNPSEIDTSATYPSGTIAPLTDSVFDFRSYTPSCCGAVTITFVDTCRTTLQTCTASSAGVELFSAFWLLHGNFTSLAEGVSWAQNCVKNYIVCMQNGVVNTPPPSNELCNWADSAPKKMQDPSECEVFIMAALIGMNQVASVGTASDICSTVTGTGGVTTTPAPNGLGSTPSDIVAGVPACQASSSPHQCLRNYRDSGSCTCPATTTSQTVSFLTGYYSLPSNHHAILALPASSTTCVRGAATLGLCIARTAQDYEAITSFTRDILDVTINATKYRLGGSCLERNPRTGHCSCPSNTSAFEYALPQVNSANKAEMRIVTFCMPPHTATFFVGRRDWDTNAPVCFHPFGSNFSCACSEYATKRTLSISIYKTRFATTTVPGELVFCDSDENFPDEIDPAIVVTTIGITVVAGVAGNSMSAVQAAALMMTMCNQNKSNDGAKKMLVFEKIDAVGAAGRFLFACVLGFGVVGLHFLVTFIYWLLLVWVGKPIPNFESGFVPSDKHSVDFPAVTSTADAEASSSTKKSSSSKYENNKNTNNNEEEGGEKEEHNTAPASPKTENSKDEQQEQASGLHPTKDIFATHSFWEAACLKTRYPHWSAMFLRVVFPGFMLEAGGLFRNENSGLIAVGTVGIIVGCIFVLVTIYLCWFGIKEDDPEIQQTDCPPDRKQEEEDSGKDSKNKNENKYIQQQGDAGNVDENEENDDDGAITTKKILVKPKEDLVDVEDENENMREMTPKNNDETPGNETISSPSKEKLLPGDEENTLDSNNQIKLPPMFIWYTDEATLHQFPNCLRWVFVPRGWWSQRRFFNRRFATFYNTYLPKSSRWFPSLVTIFMMVVSLIAVANECEIPLAVVGTINFLMMIVTGVFLPYRRPMENFFMIAQFLLAGCLGFARSQSFVENIWFFYALLLVGVTALVHHGLVQLFEVVYTYDTELARFHDPAAPFDPPKRKDNF